MITQAQMLKLPAYLRNHILDQNREIENLRAEVAWRKDEDRIKVDASNTVVVEGIEHHTPIIPFSEVEFRLEDSEGVWLKPAISARLRRDGKTLEIMGCSGNALAITPQASNVIHVTLRG